MTMDVAKQQVLIANVHRVFEDMSFVVRKPEDTISHQDTLLYKTKDDLKLATRYFFVL
jgi:hypothetical protein